ASVFSFSVRLRKFSNSALRRRSWSKYSAAFFLDSSSAWARISSSESFSSSSGGTAGTRSFTVGSLMADRREQLIDHARHAFHERHHSPVLHAAGPENGQRADGAFP